MKRQKDEIRRILELSQNEKATLDALESIYFIVLSDLVLSGETYMPFIGRIKSHKGVGNINGKDFTPVKYSIMLDTQLKDTIKSIKNNKNDSKVVKEILSDYLDKLRGIVENNE